MIYKIIYSLEARQNLLKLDRYLTKSGSPQAAQRYVASLLATCESLRLFPQRGSAREDLGPGIRITHHRSKTVIAFALFAETVQIIGIYHGGQDYERRLRPFRDESV